MKTNETIKNKLKTQQHMLFFIETAIDKHFDKEHSGKKTGKHRAHTLEAIYNAVAGDFTHYIYMDKSQLMALEGIGVKRADIICDAVKEYKADAARLLQWKADKIATAKSTAPISHSPESEEWKQLKTKVAERYVIYQVVPDVGIKLWCGFEKQRGDQPRKDYWSPYTGDLRVGQFSPFKDSDASKEHMFNGSIKDRVFAMQNIDTAKNNAVQIRKELGKIRDELGLDVILSPALYQGDGSILLPQRVSDRHLDAVSEEEFIKLTHDEFNMPDTMVPFEEEDEPTVPLSTLADDLEENVDEIVGMAQKIGFGDDITGATHIDNETYVLLMNEWLKLSDDDRMELKGIDFPKTADIDDCPF
jgi:hypothetical protein